MVAGLLVLCLAPPAARAGDKDKPESKEDVEKVKAFYSKGRTLYDLGRYDDAAVEFEKAFEAKQDPAFLFNIAQAYRLAGRLEKSRQTYRAFLRRVPNAPNRAEVEKRIAEISDAIAKNPALANGPAAGTAPPPPPPTTPPPPGTVPPPPGPSPAPVATGPSPAPSPAPTGGPAPGGAGPSATPAPTKLADGKPSSPPPPGVDLKATVGPEPKKKELWEEWWFWGGIGAAVVGGTIIAIAVASSGDSSKLSGNVSPGRVIVK